MSFLKSALSVMVVVGLTNTMVNAAPVNTTAVLDDPRTVYIENGCDSTVWVRHEWNDIRDPDQIVGIDPHGGKYEHPQRFSDLSKNEGGRDFKLAWGYSDIDSGTKTDQFEYPVTSIGLTYDLSHENGNPMGDIRRHVTTDNGNCAELQCWPGQTAECDWPDKQSTNCPSANLWFFLC
ncbi:hypothetical protein K402DRAFT_421338 [Aulographum hederae CBS 113979]|uniref:Secreted protein n=1 Tax=Aulographum hederae CBS 113979 TaxID=1176131 RepID=A0A6G1GZ78_9PEZI|nr:hypothetical protein K402DRAFT_421338 [Aulographum hederae CBS 113979]